MHAKPEKQHDWLQKFIGQWTYESEASMGPDDPAEKIRGSETVRTIGGLWIVAEGTCEMPGGGGTGTTVLTLGYDPEKQAFVGTWLGSMMTNLWIYRGQLDAAGNVLTLDTEGPNFTVPGQTAKYQETIAWQSDDVRTFNSDTFTPAGERVPIMRAVYRRVK